MVSAAVNTFINLFFLKNIKKGVLQRQQTKLPF